MPQDLINRSKSFALRIIKLCDAMPKTTAGKNIANQLLRSGTSIAANYRASQRARSRAEFISKIRIVLEESDEAQFWLELIMESGLLQEKKISLIYQESKELTAIFTTISKSTFKR